LEEVAQETVNEHERVPGGVEEFHAGLVAVGFPSCLEARTLPLQSREHLPDALVGDAGEGVGLRVA